MVGRYTETRIYDSKTQVVDVKCVCKYCLQINPYARDIRLALHSVENVPKTVCVTKLCKPFEHAV